MNLEALISQLSNIMYFLIVLGLAVIFHEWGHFIVAKLLGAKVDRFAVGFGQKLFSYTWHDTEYAVCALPLGGYVKIRGMDPDDEMAGEEWEFLQLAPWKRILIVAAGPIMNFVLAFLITVIILLAFGQAFTATTTIGYVPVGSTGWEMGLRDGDKILSVIGKEVNSLESISGILTEFVSQDEDKLNNKLVLTIERDGQILQKSKDIPAVLLTDPSKNNNTEQVKLPEVYDGILVTGVLPGGVADKAGLKAGSVISAVDGKKFTSREEWTDFITNRYQKDAGQYQPIPVTLTVLDPTGKEQTVILQPELVMPAEDAVPYQPKTKIDILYDAEISVKEYFTPTISLLGVAPKLTPIVGTVQEGSPAERAGLTEGSHIVEIDKKPVDDWLDVLMAIQDSVQPSDSQIPTATPLELTWLTPNQEMKTSTVTPNVTLENIITPSSIKTGKRYPVAHIGVDLHADRNKVGIIGAVVGAADWVIDMTGKMFGFIIQLFTGQVSPRLLGGPIAIYQLSGESGRWGMEKFLQFIALLSANLGLLNLFPLPPLDGGHIVFYLYEMIRRKPITMRQMENFGKVGFALIIPLILFLIINDLNRINLFSWLTGLFT